MKFRLERKSSTGTLVKFHVKNSKDEAVGVISVPPSEEADLLANWSGPGDPAPARTKPEPRTARANPFRPLEVKMDPRAVLRGC
jgi:hypothetical protein